MKAGNTNPMGKASTSHKPDAGVLRMVKAKMSNAKLNPPTAKMGGTNPMAGTNAPKPAKAKLNRPARTS